MLWYLLHAFGFLSTRLPRNFLFRLCVHSPVFIFFYTSSKIKLVKSLKLVQTIQDETIHLLFQLRDVIYILTSNFSELHRLNRYLYFSFLFKVRTDEQ